MKYIRIHVYEYTERVFASNLSHRDRKPKLLNKFWTKHGGDGKRWPLPPIPLPCALAFPPPSNRDATTPSPCWAPHFMTLERIMFSHPTPSKPHLCPAATMSDDTPSALTPPLHCACMLRPAASPQLVAFESRTISAPICLNRFTFAESRMNHGNPICEPVCVFLPFPLLPLLFW